MELSERDGTKNAAKLVVPLILSILKENKVIDDKPSIVDFGCGPGIWLEAFKKNGCRVQGYDGGTYKPYYRIKQDEFMNVNLTEKINFKEKYDLAITLEVAEHIEEKKSYTFLQNITRASDYIVFSAAIPMQLGQGHVNEQWPSYWGERFDELGYACLDIIRPLIWRDEYRCIDFFYQQNMLLFVKKNEKNHDFISKNIKPVYDLVHPRQWEKIHTWMPVRVVMALYNNPYTYRIFEKYKKFKRHKRKNDKNKVKT